MGRRQQQVPPAPAGSALASGNGGGGSGGGRSAGGARSSSGSVDFVPGKDGGFMTGAATGAATGAGGLLGGAGAEEAERAFWELVFSRHERLHPLLEDLRLGSAARARQLARVHCARHFSDLVYAGLDPQEGVVGFHRTPAFQAFLDELVASQQQQQLQAGPTPQGVEAFVQQVRPDFATYLNPPGE